jgi:hypothetical protein
MRGILQLGKLRPRELRLVLALPGTDGQSSFPNPQGQAIGGRSWYQSKPQTALASMAALCLSAAVE